MSTLIKPHPTSEVTPPHTNKGNPAGGAHYRPRKTIHFRITS